MRNHPSQLQRVCIRQSSIQSGIVISWDLLSCCLQNGADISNYTIRYTRLETGTLKTIFISDNGLQCDQLGGGLYSCLATASLFISIPGEIYSFQVAARNKFGAGSFSDPVIFAYRSQGKYIAIVKFI